MKYFSHFESFLNAAIALFFPHSCAPALECLTGLVCVVAFILGFI